MTSAPLPLSTYEADVRRFEPVQGLAATNRNDLRRFVHEWFTHFEHASSVDRLLAHLEDREMSLSFPGMAPLTTHAAFAAWYANLLANTRWNFHEVSALQIEPTGPRDVRISFIVDWYGEVRPDSTQRAGWQSRPDSGLYHHRLRQTWAVRTGEPLLIRQLVVQPGDTPSPIDG